MFDLDCSPLTYNAIRLVLRACSRVYELITLKTVVSDSMQMRLCSSD